MNIMSTNERVEDNIKKIKETVLDVGFYFEKIKKENNGK